MIPPLITLEEHFLGQGVKDRTRASYNEQFKQMPGVEDKLKDVGKLRIEHMDAGKVSLQVVSHGPIPGGPSLEEAIAVNNQLHVAVLEHPTRFAGFATVPMSKPEQAVQELVRCIKELGFLGALIDNHVDGRYYDGDEYLAFWNTVEKLDVPIYIHPTDATDTLMPMYTGNYSDAAQFSLAASAVGWHSQTQLHILRLFASGLFDKCPRLKIIIGHFGEMIPFMLERIMTVARHWGDFDRSFETVWKTNIWITTSGVWSMAPLAAILINTPIDRVLYSVDYPFLENEAGLKWMEELERNGMVTSEQLAMIAYQNTEKLLGIKLKV